MKTTFQQMVPLILASFYAAGMSVFWAITRLDAKDFSLAHPGPYVAVCLVGCMASYSLVSVVRRLERRIEQLEQQLSDRAGQSDTSSVVEARDVANETIS